MTSLDLSLLYSYEETEVNNYKMILGCKLYNLNAFESHYIKVILITLLLSQF